MCCQMRCLIRLNSRLAIRLQRKKDIIVTAAESQIQDAELKEFGLAPGEMPPGKLPGHDMLMQSCPKSKPRPHFRL